VLRRTELTCRSVIVATGVIALVDNSIITTWPQDRPKAFYLPLWPLPLGLDCEYIGARKLIDEIFNRDDRSRRRASTSMARHPRPWQ
jgi:hypothetical protein